MSPDKTRAPKPDVPLPATNADKRRPGASGFPIVGIGASAGGLESFQQLLGALPADTGMAFVLVSHLDPQHESLLAEILSRSTPMPVKQVTARVHVRANYVYVIPPNTSMTIARGVLRLAPRSQAAGQYLPIDGFLVSLAEDRGRLAIGVILSGTGSDGAHGIQAIQAAGGITFAQTEASAAYPDMPHGAALTGSVDFILPPADIARRLADSSRHPYLGTAAATAPPAEAPRETETAAGDGADLQPVLGILRTATGVDFSGYKRGTLERRLQRRMLLQNLDRLDEYIAFLGTHPAEVETLYEDLLIKVTSFFRWPEKFEALKTQVFPALIAQAAPENGIRIWVPACATGEEAYSIAIVLAEALEALGSKVPARVFATDVSEKAIEHARAGIYSAAGVNGLAPERLERYFVPRDGGYQVARPIRELCVFAVHNLLADAPLSRIGLISCCNLLIYLQPALQHKVVATFHYALQPEGFLMLGDAEALSPGSLGFATLDEHQKLYVRLAAPGGAQVDFSTPDLQTRADSRRRMDRASLVPLGSIIDDEADRLLLERSALAGVVVNANLDILKFRGDTSPYLEHPTGNANLNLLQLAREELFLELRAAAAKARRTARAVRKEGLHVKRDRRVHRFNLEVVPLRTTGADPHFLVLFEETSPAGRRRAKEPAPGKHKPRTPAEQIAEYKRELAAAARQLHALAREHDAVQETLRLAHEEALSSNEELQSLNEELRTSKEEVQASNEELITLNDELRARGAQAEAARQFAESVVATVREPLVILDADLYVKNANPAFYRLFQVTPAATEARRIYRLGDDQWDIPELRRLLEELLPHQTEIANFEVTHEFPGIGRRTMLLSAHQIDSLKMILLAIQDVTAERDLLRQQEEETRLREQFLSVASHELRGPVTVIQGHVQGLVRWVNKQAALSGPTAGEETPATVALERARLVSSLEKTEAAVRQLAALMTRLLNLKYLLETTGASFTPERMDLAGLMATVIEAEAAKRETSPGVPPVAVQFDRPAEPVWGDWDAGQIRQVLVNLLDNAVKYSPPGGTVRVVVSCDEAAGHGRADLVAHVLIRDEGIGIPRDYLQRIFELFVRGPNVPADIPSGGGLGLAICQQIVERHGGRLWAESAGVGQGSTFHLLLPGNHQGERA